MKITESRARQAGKTRNILTQELAQKVVDEALTIKVFNATEISGDSIIKIVGQALDRASGNMEKPTYLALNILGVGVAVRQKDKQNINLVILKRTKGEE